METNPFERVSSEEIKEDKYSKLPLLSENSLGKSIGYDFVVDGERYQQYVGRMMEEPGWLQDFSDERSDEDWRVYINPEATDLEHMIRGGSDEMSTAIALRLAEMITDDNGVEYAWSGGDFNLVEQDVYLSFCLNLNEAMKFVYSGNSGKREKPCLIRIGLKNIVEEFRKNPRHLLLLEHGPASLLDYSFDINTGRFEPEVFRADMIKPNDFRVLVEKTKDLSIGDSEQ